MQTILCFFTTIFLTKGHRYTSTNAWVLSAPVKIVQRSCQSGTPALWKLPSQTQRNLQQQQYHNEYDDYINDESNNCPNPNSRNHGHPSFDIHNNTTPRKEEEENLSGEIIGDNYLVCDEIKQSNSGSTIYTAYRRSDEIDDENDRNNNNIGQPIGEQVIIKVSEDTEALEREQQNYNIVSNNSNENDGNFIEAHEYLQPMEEHQSKNSHDNVHHDNNQILTEGKGALVMEKGVQDVKDYLRERRRQQQGLLGPLKEGELRKVARAYVDCIADFHKKQMVWTEMKSQNFVISHDGTVKGIDVEGAVPYGSNYIDFTPKACPPEFISRYVQGKEHEVGMEYKFDIWSLGMALYELSNDGAHYYEGVTDELQVVLHLNQTIQHHGVIDNLKYNHYDFENVDYLLKDLIYRCLSINPHDRPTIEEVQNHPFFQQSDFSETSTQ